MEPRGETEREESGQYPHPTAFFIKYIIWGCMWVSRCRAIGSQSDGISWFLGTTLECLETIWGLTKGALGWGTELDKCPALPLFSWSDFAQFFPLWSVQGFLCPYIEGTLPAHLGHPVMTKFPAHLIPDSVLGFPISWSILPLPKSPVGFVGAGQAW